MKHVPMAQHRHASVEISEAGDDTDIAATTPQASPQNTGCDDEDGLENNEENPISVESEEEQVESADDELGKYLFKAN